MKTLFIKISGKFILFTVCFMFMNTYCNAQAFTTAITVHGTTSTTWLYLGHGTYNTPSNTAVGTGTLASTTSTTGNNTAVGYNCLSSITSATGNTSTGSGALTATTTGNNNSAVGYGSLQSNTTGRENAAVGDLSLLRNTTGIYNTAFGAFAGSEFTSGNNYNTFIGANSGFHDNGFTTSMSGDENVALGSASLSQLLVGSSNTAIGASAQDQLTNGSNNVAIGYRARANGGGVATISNSLSIQNVIYGNNMSTTANGVIGIGVVPTGTPSGGVLAAGALSKLHISGFSSTQPSLQLDYVPSTSAVSGRSFLFVDATGVVAQSPLPGGTFCTSTGYIPRATDAIGNSGCSQIYDNLTNIGIAVASPTAKLDIDCASGATAGTIRIRNLQANNGTYLNPLLIDANGYLYRGGSTLTKNSSINETELNDKINRLEQDVANLRELVELMMKNNTSTSSIPKSYTVYPNPAKNIVRIQMMDKLMDNLNQYAEIRDINNKVVVDKKLFKQSLNISLDGKLASGTYSLIIYQNEQIIQTEKIVIAK